MLYFFNYLFAVSEDGATCNVMINNYNIGIYIQSPNIIEKIYNKLYTLVLCFTQLFS